MHRKALLLLSAFILAGYATAQDVVKVAPNHYKVLVDNEYVRVVQNTLAPGEKDPIHIHPAGWYYVTSPGSMKVTSAEGKVTMWEPKLGEQGWLNAEAPHTSENVGKNTLVWVLVEVKSASKSK